MDGEVSDQQLWSWIDREAPELDAWLRVHPSGASRVAQLRGLVDGMREQTRTAVPGLPDRIGPFAITGILGAGGMGIVYAGRQEAPSRDVAVKVLRDVGPSLDERERFFAREIDVLGQLAHPGIAAIQVSGVTGDGLRWFAMERVFGRPLHLVLRDATLSREARVRLVLGVADAVGYAHARGVVHRDLKPSNVMVTDDGGVKVVDFGLAKLVDDPHAPAMTQTSAVLGTLPYASPEVAEHGARTATPASDVWSLGVLLFESLTGKLPLQPRDASTSAVFDAVRSGATRRLRAVDATLPRDLDAIVATALAPDPRRRYPTATELADDLRRQLAGAPIHASGWTLRDRLTWWFERHRTRMIAATSIAVVLVAFGVWAWIERPGLGAFAAFADLRGEGGDERAPWQAVTWKDDVPWVTLEDGSFVRPIAVDGEPIELLLGVAKRAEPRRFRKRFEEDFTTLFRLVAGHELGATTTLTVLTAGGDAPIVREGVAVTRTNRVLVWQANQTRSPFVAWRFDGDALVAQLADDDTWVRVHAIHGVSVARLLDVMQRVRGAADPRDEFDALLVRAFEELGDEPTASVALDVSDPDGSRRRTVEAKLIEPSPTTFSPAPPGAPR